jgi:hypothetical protein
MPLPAPPADDAGARRSASLRTALILASIALVFFGGIIATQYAGGNTVGMGVLGLAIIGFLLITLGRKSRRNPPTEARK